MLAIALFSGFLLYYIRYLRAQSFLHLVLAILFLSLAVFTRYVIFVIAFPLLLHTIFFWFKHVGKIYHWLVLIIPVAVIFLFHLFNENLFQFMDHDSIAKWTIKNIFGTSYESKEGIKQVKLPNIFYQLAPLIHPGFIFLGALFIFFGIKIGGFFNLEKKLLIISYFTFTVFVAGYHDQNPRHFLPCFIISILLCFPGFVHLSQRKEVRNYKNLIFSLIIIFQIGLCIRAIAPTYQRNLLEKAISADLNNRINEKTLYAFDMDIALKSRGVPQEIQSLYTQKFTTFENNALLLVNIPKWSNQWKNMNPMINWNLIQSAYELSVEKQFADGWVLYKMIEK